MKEVTYLDIETKGISLGFYCSTEVAGILISMGMVVDQFKNMMNPGWSTEESYLW